MTLPSLSANQPSFAPLKTSLNSRSYFGLVACGQILRSPRTALGRYERLQAEVVTEENMYLLYCVFLSFLFLPTCSLSAWSGGGIRNYLPLLAHGGKNNHLIAFFSCASAKAGASLFVVLILGTASNPKITDDRKSHQVHSGFTFVF